MRARIVAAMTSAFVLLSAGAASAATAPAAPTAVTAVPGNTNATVSWTAPADTGGEPITSYTVTSTPKNATCSTAALTCVVPGLSNGTAYTFTVTATNATGTGPASAPSSPVTPRTVPGAPTLVRGTAGNGRATVSWRQPSSDGGSPIASYTATASPGGSTCTTTNSLSCAVPNLTNGQAYTFTVTATNAAGASPASAASPAVTPRATPAPPTAVTATAGNARVTVTWSAPADTGGSAITRYSVSASPGTRRCTTTTALTCAVTGLTNGQTYTFTVRASNSAGTGEPSAASSPVVPRTTPAAVTSLNAARSADRAATVTWSAPASNGGSPITGYSVTSIPDGQQCTTAALTCTVEGLTPGTRYTFRVVAVNVAGDGTPRASAPLTMPRLQQTARVRVANRIKFQGRTVVLRAPVITNAGQRARARIAVTPGKRKFVRTKTRASGKIIVRTKGVRSLRVTLTVTAPGTAQFQPYAFDRTWRVRPSV